ncbi:hypothetical protein KC345_g9360 [Hortaea werneckii]|nr:hypothetical protein KC345_g9360 [Hortaea werneckii]
MSERVDIPYEGITLPGYFYRQDDSPEPRPTLIIHGGYDSTGEELYFNAAAALQRGYNCLTFEGPGQGAVIREQGLPFRPDWEAVITPVMDFLLTRPEADRERIALLGISFGGYLAPRAAAFEHRLAACIASDGLFSFQFGEMGKKSMAGGSGSGSSCASPLGSPDSPEFAQAIEAILKQNTGVRWAIDNGRFTFRAASLPELVQKTESYTLEGIAGLITCPTLVCEAEADHFFVGQPELLYQALECPKTYMKFTAEEGAEEHCHFGALTLFNHRLFTWLDETLHIPRPALA